MVLDIRGQMKEQLFKNSKENNEGLNTQQTKRKQLIIQGSEIHPMNFEIGNETQFSKDGGVYLSQTDNHSIITAVSIESGATIHDIEVIGTFSKTWYYHIGTGAPITGLANQKKKVNRIVDYSRWGNYWTVTGMIGDEIQRIIINYTI